MVVGAQWGDEGKGKLIHFLAARAHVVVRWSAGNNAGHSVVTSQGQKLVISSLPVGVLTNRIVSIIGPGCLVNLNALTQELKILRQAGYRVSNLLISERAHLILPYHLALDVAREKNRSMLTIGTTNKGIGPCCEDRASRTGIRIGELKHWSSFLAKLKRNTTLKNQVLTHIYQVPPVNLTHQIDEIKTAFSSVQHKIVNVVDYFNQLPVWHQQHMIVLCEGAQGALLDLDFGTYPYVTSSRPLAPLATVGSGLNGTGQVIKIGVVKAYNSRVGRGSFPTEIKMVNIADHLVSRGGEFGAVTGRKRRVGWLDLVALRHSCWINGYHVLAIMLLDVLDELAELKLCTAYTMQHKQINYFPADETQLMVCVPHYVTIPGWKTSIRHVKTWSGLPTAAKNYLNRISDYVRIPIAVVSVGPQPEQTILLPAYHQTVINRS